VQLVKTVDGNADASAGAVYCGCAQYAPNASGYRLAKELKNANVQSQPVSMIVRSQLRRYGDVTIGTWESRRTSNVNVEGSLGGTNASLGTT